MSQPPNPENNSPWDRFFVDLETLIKKNRTREELREGRMSKRYTTKVLQGVKERYKYTFEEISKKKSAKKMYQLSVAMNDVHLDENDKISMHDLFGSDIYTKVGYSVMIIMPNEVGSEKTVPNVYLQYTQGEELTTVMLYNGIMRKGAPEQLMNNLYSTISQTVGGKTEYSVPEQ